ncbi:M15 family metallopeptidase [Nocardioides sp.]|uniref:M15 family metallopeptidase n=1 Tax=Nocardioides sp. TaxID=35761 RepID=UPI002B279FBB|nr:M15 family metallopeptidase [Nocardioides sp.]
MGFRSWCGLLAAAVLFSGCSQSAAPTPTPGMSTAPTVATAAPTPTPEPTPSYSTWPLGERALPLRPDGFGEIRATPPSLRERRYPTVDLLAPPADGRFSSSIGPVTDEILEQMGETYQPGCPVTPEDLRYVQVVFRGFDGAAHTGELVVAASEAAGIVSVFRTLFRLDFPIEEMRLITTADLEAPATGDGNNTAAFICRPTRGQASLLSAHAYGLALDVNPFLNPYAKDDVVLPERASSYLDRDRVRPGMIEADGPVVRAFARIGWSWGGDFRTLEDYQHFSALAR